MMILERSGSVATTFCIDVHMYLLFLHCRNACHYRIILSTQNHLDFRNKVCCCKLRESEPGMILILAPLSFGAALLPYRATNCSKLLESAVLLFRSGGGVPSIPTNNLVLF